MKISLRQLEIFTLTAQHNNISKAAEAACISQSAASMALSQLESLLNQPLFHRKGKRLILNETGKELADKANDILQRTNAFEAYAAQSNKESGTLRLAASTTIANYLLPEKIVLFKKQYPNINIELFQLNSQSCIKELLQLNIDLALIEGYYPDIKTTLTPWQKDRLIIFCNPKHPLAKKSSITLTNLKKQHWLLRENGSGTRQLFDSATQQNKLNIESFDVINNSISIKEFIKASNDSLACLSEKVIADDLKSKKLIALNIKSFSIMRSFYIVERKNSTPLNAYHLFLKFLSK